MNIKGLKNKLLASLASRSPRIAQMLAKGYQPDESREIPFVLPEKPLKECRVAIVTTAGVHHVDQTPFDMDDQSGDPTFRIIDANRPDNELTVTHNYYNIAGALKDINVVFPLARFRELAEENIIGETARYHYGFMGHITGHHISTLINKTAPEAAADLRAKEVDCVLLTPG